MKEIDRLKQDIEFSAELAGHQLKFTTTWGLFSPEKIDEGTQLLIDHLDIGLGETSLDLGCGYGPLGITIAKLSPAGYVHLVDKDFAAVEYTKRNLELNGVSNAETYLSNGFSLVHARDFDNIVSNLPAKVSRELIRLFLLEGKERLKPGGKFYVVTISGLKDYIKREFNEVFGNYKKLGQSKTYTAAVAVKQ